MKCCLGISNFLKEISNFSYCFSLFLFIDHSGRLSYLSLLFFGTLHSDACIFFSPLPLASLLFSAICKASSESHFAFLHIFFLGMVLITASCSMSQPSVHSSSGTLSDLIPWIYLSRPLCNCKGFDLGQAYTMFYIHTHTHTHIYVSIKNSMYHYLREEGGGKE